jgi:predicted alpha/beta-hydrolase family hydrolase
MLWVSDVARAGGLRPTRFNFGYRVVGRAIPDKMPVLVATYREVIDSVRDRLRPRRLIIGGHSMGGRAASMLLAEEGHEGVHGLLLFGYPLHPPGRLDKLRNAHLPAIRVPTLQLSGTRDEFCDRLTMERVMKTLDPSTWTLRWVEGADHSYVIAKSSGRTRTDAAVEMSKAISGWMKTV